jgi:hypothetical protein
MEKSRLLGRSRLSRRPDAFRTRRTQKPIAEVLSMRSFGNFPCARQSLRSRTDKCPSSRRSKLLAARSTDPFRLPRSSRPAFRLGFEDGIKLVLTEPGMRKHAGVWLLAPEAAEESLARLECSLALREQGLGDEYAHRAHGKPDLPWHVCATRSRSSLTRSTRSTATRTVRPAPGRSPTTGSRRSRAGCPCPPCRRPRLAYKLPAKCGRNFSPAPEEISG